MKRKPNCGKRRSVDKSPSTAEFIARVATVWRFFSLSEFRSRTRNKREPRCMPIEFFAVRRHAQYIRYTEYYIIVRDGWANAIRCIGYNRICYALLGQVSFKMTLFCVWCVYNTNTRRLTVYWSAGIPELGIEEVEPIVIDEINLSLGSGPDGYRATFKDIQAYGVSNLTVNQVR